MKKTLALICTIIIGFCTSNIASAQACSTSSISNVNFGNISAISGLTYTATGSLQINCGAYPANTKIRFCISIPTGDVTGTGYTPRQMQLTTGGATRLNYNLSYNPSMTPIWGTISAPTANSHLTLDLVTNAAGVITQVAPIYGSIPANQTSLPVGIYESEFSSGVNRGEVRYATYTTTAPTCTTNMGTSIRFGFKAVATVVADCTVSATPMNFGSTAALSSAITTTNTITVRCTNAKSYTLGANAGISGSTLPTRQISLSPTQKITYQLYSSSAYSIIWGNDTNGTSTLAGTGTGANQNYTIYGRILPQTVPASGVYTDTITVTVTY